MRIPHLQIATTTGRIGIRTQNAVLSIHQQSADMKIRQPKAEMHIQKVPGKLLIDQSEAFSEENLKPVSELIADNAKRGRSAALQGIARRAEEGDRLMKIEKGGNLIAELAKEDSAGPEKKFGIGWMPKSMSSVKIHYQPAQVNIQWTTHQPEINVALNPPKFQYAPGSVDVYMRQWPSINIQVVGGNYDKNI